MQWIKEHKALLAALALAALFALAPIAEAWYFVGSEWRGVVQAYGDEIIYQTHIHEIADGHIGYGNPYFIEHAGEGPLVVFAGIWVAAIPLLFGVPLYAAVYGNFIIWSMVFVGLLYLLFRELSLPKWYAAFGALFAYLQYNGGVWRPSNQQQVDPVYLLFFITLARFLKKPQERSRVVLLGIATGATFYVFSYLWQAVAIMFGLLVLYALWNRAWELLRGALTAGFIGAGLGLPLLAYMFWQIKTLPYFWESVERFGLVQSHIPMAEILYSGGWAVLLVALLALLYWRIPAVRSEGYRFVTLFTGVTGLGLWIMQGSNLITGKQLETGEHIKVLLVTWLAIATLTGVAILWRQRYLLSQYWRVIATGVLALLVCANVYFGYKQLSAFLFFVEPDIWKEQQLYAAPMAWLDAHEKEPVVVWGNPHDYSTQHVVVLSKNYVLYASTGIFHYVSNQEVFERYLVSSYFDNPSENDLKADIFMYLGRGDVYHHAKTIERGVKLCRIFLFWKQDSECGATPTSIELLGEPFFAGLENKFTKDIRPNIKEYLKKYHVSYILKDIKLDPQYHPERLGAQKVYTDGRFEIHKLP